MPFGRPSLAILGIRGIPASHGGFETFAERLALHLVAQGWRVLVYCQVEGLARPSEDDWRGIRRILLPGRDSPIGSMRFDWASITDVLRQDVDLSLTLGYNTAAFGLRLRRGRMANLINMDGIEWQRDKWGAMARLWFYCNDWLGCRLGDHLIADHPQIERHLQTRTRADRITMIPYGADRLENTPTDPLSSLALEPGRYLTVIARAEPENSILEMVRAFSSRRRGLKLVVLGRYDNAASRYHARVQSAASDEVLFPGGIYDPDVVRSLRAHSLMHLHGHRVGGTNPSLVEALGAGNAIIAHDNPFNRWVAQDAAQYFTDERTCLRQIDDLLADPERLKILRRNALHRHAAHFQWSSVLATYEALLREYLPVSHRLAERMALRMRMGESVGVPTAIDPTTGS